MEENESLPGVEKTTDAALKLNDVIDAINSSTKSIAETFKSIDLSHVTNFTNDINKATKEWVDNVKDVSSEFRKELEILSLLSQDMMQFKIGGELSNRERAIAAHYSKQENENMDKKLELADSYFVKLKREMEYHGQQLDELAPKTKALYKTMDEGARMMSTPAALPGQLMNAMPGSGILSFLVMGMNQSEKWRSMTEQVTQTFDKIGGGAKRFAGDIEGHIKTLSNDLIGGAQTLIAVSNQFAAAGILADVAWGRSGLTGTLVNVGDSLGEVSLKFDMLNEAAPGTTATMIGQAYSQFGNNIEAATDAIVKYGMEVRAAGLDGMQFASSILQSSQSMKLYGIQLDSVAAATMKVYEANKSAGLGGSFSMTVGQAGVGQIIGGLSSIAPGLAAVIGQDVTSRLGRESLLKDKDFNFWTGGGSGFGIMMEMRQGFRNAPEEQRGRFMGESISALYNRAMTASGGSAPEAQYWLEKMGFGIEGARAILQVGKSVTDRKSTDLSAADQKILAEAMKTEAEKTSSMDRALQYLVTAVGDIAIGLLGLILGALTTLVDAVRLGITYLSGDTLERDRLKGRLEQDWNVMGLSMNKFAEAGKELAKAGKDFSSALPFLGLLMGGNNELSDAIATEQKAAEADVLKDAARGGKKDNGVGILQAQATSQNETLLTHLSNITEGEAAQAGFTKGQIKNIESTLKNNSERVRSRLQAVTDKVRAGSATKVKVQSKADGSYEIVSETSTTISPTYQVPKWRG